MTRVRDAWADGAPHFSAPFVARPVATTLLTLGLALGGVLAAPIFASTAIAVPLLLDRRVSLYRAVLLSWQVVLANPLPMALWAALIMGFTLLGMASGLLGLIAVVPMLGHASWHAYRALVDASTLPPRTAG